MSCSSQHILHPKGLCWFIFQELEVWATDFVLPATVWLAGFFNPQSFLTAIMQSTARKKQWPLDKMCLAADVTKKTREEITFPPREGSYVHGLFMEGKNCISEMFQTWSRPSSAFSFMQPSSVTIAGLVCPTLVAAQSREPWVNLGPPGSRLSRQLRAALLGSHSLSKPKIHVLAIQAPAHEHQGSWSYRALVNTYVTFLAGAQVRQIEKLKSIIITANEREGGSSAEQLRGPLRQKHRAHGTA